MIIVHVSGNLGKDAEQKHLDSGKQVTKFSVAAKTRGKSAETIWFDCELWGERGGKIAAYLTKGKNVSVVGSLSKREHEGKTYLKVDVQELDLHGGGEKRPETNDGHAEERMPF